MRVAVVSDIHGNLTALKAVLSDIRQCSPDLVLHGGDLADLGSSPVEVVDQIRDLGWEGVIGNTDEMLIRPESLKTFASQSSAPPALWERVRQIASATRSKLEALRDWLGYVNCQKRRLNRFLHCVAQPVAIAGRRPQQRRVMQSWKRFMVRLDGP